MNRKVLGVLVLLAAALVVNVNAQERVRANVPFEFVAADRALPAGMYDITEVAAHAMFIREYKSGNAMMVQFRPASGKQVMHAKLVFHKYGDRYFLYQAWSVDGEGIQVRKSELEKEQSLADGGLAALQEVVVALR